MAKLNLEQLVLDLIKIIKESVFDDTCVDIHTLTGALKMQGLKINDKGELVDINEKEPEPPVEYYVYNEDEKKWERSSEEPPMDSLDYLIRIAGTRKFVRKSDYIVYNLNKMEGESLYKKLLETLNYGNGKDKDK